MRRGRLETLAAELRRGGVRVSTGPWTLCVNTTSVGAGRLVLVIGRAAGGAVTRSRIRRLARTAFTDRRKTVDGVDCLLLVRSDVSDHPRRKIRADLTDLLARLPTALARRQTKARTHV